MNASESKQYSPLNIIESLDGDNDHKSLHSKADLEFQDYVDTEFVTSENTTRLGSLTQLRVMLFLVVAALANKPWTSYGKECVIKIHYFSLN